MVSAAHIDRERGLSVLPRASDMRRAGAVVNDGGAHALNPISDRLSVEQINGHPARARSRRRWRATGAIPGDEIDLRGPEQIEKMAARKPGRSRDEDHARHGGG